jgi:hypothetical protein
MRHVTCTYLNFQIGTAFLPRWCALSHDDKLRNRCRSTRLEGFTRPAKILQTLKCPAPSSYSSEKHAPKSLVTGVSITLLGFLERFVKSAGHVLPHYESVLRLPSWDKPYGSVWTSSRKNITGHIISSQSCRKQDNLKSTSLTTISQMHGLYCVEREHCINCARLCVWLRLTRNLGTCKKHQSNQPPDFVVCTDTVL